MSKSRVSDMGGLVIFSVTIVIIEFVRAVAGTAFASGLAFGLLIAGLWVSAAKTPPT